MGVNDCRVSAELAGCAYFFACWELPQINWHHKLIPDAILSVSNQTFAIEFDRDFEGAQFFAKKVPHYEQGFPSLPGCRVLVITESANRMKALARASRFLLTTRSEAPRPQRCSCSPSSTGSLPIEI
jgi:hypothetical protein